eukprot:6550483-Prymnesium_polylepis.1
MAHSSHTLAAHSFAAPPAARATSPTRCARSHTLVLRRAAYETLVVNYFDDMQLYESLLPGGTTNGGGAVTRSSAIEAMLRRYPSRRCESSAGGAQTLPVAHTSRLPALRDYIHHLGSRTAALQPEPELPI